jgi:hypothetical protein
MTDGNVAFRGEKLVRWLELLMPMNVRLLPIASEITIRKRISNTSYTHSVKDWNHFVTAYTSVMTDIHSRRSRV